MNKTILMDFQVDKEAKRINVTREFEAPRNLVWTAWTDKDILDQWWAPKPYRAETKHLNFKEGGYWQYAMVSPQDEKIWCRADYKKIAKEKLIEWFDAFCDEKGVVNETFPRTAWHIEFADAEDATRVDITLQYKKLEDLEKIINMGFKEGFTMGLDNLDQWLSTQFALRQQNKTSTRSRVTTYLNFNGNTEEAINFYKKVFKGKFVGRGLQRFADVAMPDGAPPMNEKDKQLIIHVELEILGGHILMATDAPESMGFTLQSGNNMHINVEPDSRAETERLYKELSAGGVVSMPLQEMFFGALFTEFKDKYGINWMLTYQLPAKN